MATESWLTVGLLVLLGLLLLAALGLGIARLLRGGGAGAARQRDDWRADVQAETRQLERSLRDELTRSATATRTELTRALATFQQTLLAQQGDVARTQNEQIDSFRVQLATTQQQQTDALGQAAEQQARALARFSETMIGQLGALAQSNDQRMHEVRHTVESRLQAIQQDNERKLEQVRATVDEKLHATLEQRLGESFKQVAERLEQVHRGLGEMQGLAKDVGSLSRVLVNVKTRGGFGEVQLLSLLEEVFTAEQYGRNVETIPGTNARVDFALRLPGRRDDGAPLWLPIDAKFPREDYERLLEAHERADPAAAELAGRAIETRLRAEAKSIKDKYIGAPHTADFGILFVPTEGLYAEALRRPGLVEALQRDHKILLAGPTTLLATLTSLQMGFRTLALEKRSTEVWEVLGAVKTEFENFGRVLAKTRKKLDEASNTIAAAETRTRVMGRKLKSVEAMPIGVDPEVRTRLLPADEEALLADDERG